MLCVFLKTRGSFELLLLNPHKNVMVLYGICTDFPHGKPDGRLRLVMERYVKSVFDLLMEQRLEVGGCHGGFAFALLSFTFSVTPGSPVDVWMCRVDSPWPPCW